MYGMTAAHKTLPLPAYARVTNLRNGKSVVVRINDRGPFVANRLIDLSYTAAAKLDMLREGTTLVEVRALTPGCPTSSRAAAQLRRRRRCTCRPARSRMWRTRSACSTSCTAPDSPMPSSCPRSQRRSRLYRVRVGPVASVAEFDQLAARLAALGMPDARLASD